MATVGWWIRDGVLERGEPARPPEAATGATGRGRGWPGDGDARSGPQGPALGPGAKGLGRNKVVKEGPAFPALFPPGGGAKGARRLGLVLVQLPNQPFWTLETVDTEAPGAAAPDSSEEFSQLVTVHPVAVG